MTREADRLARAIRNSARRESQDSVLDVRAGTVLQTDLTGQIAQVKLDGELNTSSVKWFGNNAPAIGDKLHVIIKDGVMTVLGTPGPAASQIAALLEEPPQLNTSFITECWLWGHSYVGADLGRLGGYGWSTTVGHPHGLDDYLFGALGLAWPMTRTVGQSAAQLYAFVGQMLMSSGLTDPERVGMSYPYNQGVAPYAARRGAHVMVFGTNDLSFQGDPTAEGGRAITQWKHSVRSASAWLRLGAYFAPYLLYSAGAAEGGTPTASKYAGCTYTGAWTRTPPAGVAPTQGNGGLDLGNNTFYPSLGYMKTTATNASFTIRVPPDHPGTPVWLFFIGEIGQTGAPVVTISWAGGFLSTTLSTNDIVRDPQVHLGPFGPNGPAHAMCAVRVPLVRTFPQTAQTITVNAGTLAAGHQLCFAGWGIEAEDAKQITWGTIPVPKIWSGNTASLAGNATGTVMQWPSYPDANGQQPTVAPAPTDRSGVEVGDTWATQYDAATAAVASEFSPPGSVCVADLSAMNGITAKYLFRDTIHPNKDGNRVLADGLIAGMNVDPLTSTNLSSHNVGRSIVPWAMAMP